MKKYLSFLTLTVLPIVLMILIVTSVAYIENFTQRYMTNIFFLFGYIMLAIIIYTIYIERVNYIHGRKNFIITLLSKCICIILMLLIFIVEPFLPYVLLTGQYGHMLFISLFSIYVALTISSLTKSKD